MTPVTQTKFRITNSKDECIVNGNCFAACIASLLDLPITEVPNIEVFYPLKSEENFHYVVLDKFLEMKGVEIICDDRFKVFHSKTFGKKEGMREEYLKKCQGRHYLVTGTSPRRLSHITIWKDGKMIHDPHPTREGIVELTVFQTLNKLHETY